MGNRTYNFRKEKYDYKYNPKYEMDVKDIRNGIICYAPSLDLECYLNYIDLLNMQRDKWKTLGYLDLGMIPIWMAPSFMQTEGMLTTLQKTMSMYNIPCHLMPPVSLLMGRQMLSVPDLWAFRNDVAKGLSIPENELTVERMIRRVFTGGLNNIK